MVQMSRIVLKFKVYMIEVGYIVSDEEVVRIYRQQEYTNVIKQHLNRLKS
jgi:hypothetical protein